MVCRLRTADVHFTSLLGLADGPTVCLTPLTLREVAGVQAKACMAVLAACEPLSRVLLTAGLPSARL